MLGTGLWWGPFVAQYAYVYNTSDYQTRCENMECGHYINFIRAEPSVRRKDRKQAEEHSALENYKRLVDGIETAIRDASI